MRVALLSRGAHPLHAPGGMERAVFDLGRHLQAEGVETVLFTRPAEADALFPGEVVSVPYGHVPGLRHGRILDRVLHYERFARRMGTAVAAEVRAGRVDVVHAQGLTAYGYGRLRRRDATLRAPLIMNPQGMEEHKTTGLKRLALTRVRRLCVAAARLSDCVIATDAATLDEVPRYLGVDTSRVVVLENGIDLDAVVASTPNDPTAVVEKAFPSLAGRFPLALSVGRLERYKGFGDILSALTALAEQQRLERRFAWAVVGDGPERDVLERRVNRVNLATAVAHEVPGAAAAPLHVVFTGRVDEPLLHALYARADLFVHATRDEGSSLVTLEAMAHGLPVVATRAGGIPDKVSDGETGRLVAPGDVHGLAQAIAEIMADAALRRRLGVAGRAHAERKFGWREIARRTIALYEELLRRA